jgi:hypothetical protein
MMIALRRICTCVALVSLASLAAVAAAQTPTTPETPLQKQLDHVDLFLGGIGSLPTTTSGPNRLDGKNISDSPSTTVGVLVNLRYIKSPLVGLEFNYTSVRSDQDFTGTNINNTTTPNLLQIQANAHEYTLGWVFHTPRILGIQTFAGGGAGTTAFKPTSTGGLQYQEQARFTWYYDAGLEKSIISPHFGFRVAFRQAFYKAPDFETNYLSNLKMTKNIEPTAGFYLHF